MQDIEKIKQLRDETGAGILDVKKAIEKCDGDMDKARELLLSSAVAKAEKKADRNASDGLVFSYIHNNGKVGSLIHMACETDFVARTDDFVKLCKEVAMQVCTDEYADVDALLASEYMRDTSKTVKDLITGVIAKTGEKIQLMRFVKYAISE